MSNLSEFLSENGISAEDVVKRSHALERLSDEDRDQYTKRAAARRAKKPYEEAGAEKPAKLARGVSARTLKDALDGQPVARLGRKKITRAVNSLLASTKKDAVEWRVLFNDVKAKHRKTAKK